MKPHIKILVLGGTITMTSSGNDGASPTLSANDLTNALPELKTIAHISTETLMMKPSASLNWDDIRICYQAVLSALAEGCDGVVILQGTDTLEEVAFIFDVLLDVAQPIVLSGAMRATNTPGYDGPANLLAAVRIAADKSARDLGVLVVMNDVIHAARFVVKANTGFTHAFMSRIVGPIGLIQENEVRIVYRLTEKTPTFHLPDTPAPDVGLFSFAFAQRWPFQAMHEYDAIVLEAAGSGHVAGDDVAPLAKLASELPVVFTSRASNGFITQSTYHYPGSEQELIAAGLIPAGQYDGAKTRILTIFALWNKQPIDSALFNN
ncbi:MAG: asparaginase [Pseudomonadota bacterium]|nr:asparaginase [Pseudomonadota bacterium]